MRGISPQLTSGRRHTHPHQTPGLPDPLKGHSSLCVRLAPFVTLPNLPNLAKIFWQEEGTGLGLPQGTGGHLVQISMSEPVHRRRSPTPPPTLLPHSTISGLHGLPATHGTPRQAPRSNPFCCCKDTTGVRPSPPTPARRTTPTSSSGFLLLSHTPWLGTASVGYRTTSWHEFGAGLEAEA